MSKKKLLSGAKLTRSLDEAIRRLYKKKYPNPQCFVCGARPGWFHPKTNPRGCQIGHYVSRRFYATRWDQKNIWCQDSSCNYLHQHDPIPFTNAILKKYGQERLDYLENKRKETITTMQKRELLNRILEEISTL